MCEEFYGKLHKRLIRVTRTIFFTCHLYFRASFTCWPRKRQTIQDVFKIFLPWGWSTLQPKKWVKTPLKQIHCKTNEIKISFTISFKEEKDLHIRYYTKKVFPTLISFFIISSMVTSRHNHVPSPRMVEKSLRFFGLRMWLAFWTKSRIPAIRHDRRLWKRSPNFYQLLWPSGQRISKQEFWFPWSRDCHPIRLPPNT